MITNKYISRIVVILMTVATVICLCAMAFSDQLASATGGVGVVMQYESKQCRYPPQRKYEPHSYCY